MVHNIPIYILGCHLPHIDGRRGQKVTMIALFYAASVSFLRKNPSIRCVNIQSVCVCVYLFPVSPCEIGMCASQPVV
jgi:hypothetical protein